jgi:hypothetical protein
MTYYSALKDFKNSIMSYVSEILKVYGNELLLKLEDYNLLENEQNCLESSTAFGYIIEEFIVSKLEIYTKNHLNYGQYQIKRTDGSTTTSSYDCYSVLPGNIKALVNIKADKGNNNAIAAINALYNDYVIKEPEREKCYMLLKLRYQIGVGNNIQLPQRKILISNIDCFFLEELDFSKGHKQDHRNWSANYNPNSGRLQATKSFITNNLLPEEKISYRNTFNMIQNLYKTNK